MAVALVWSCSKDDGPSTPTPTPEPTNNTPTMSAQSFEVPESITDADEIGTVTASDTDEGDVLTFSIAENELFEITEAGSLSLKTGKTLNFEAKPNYEVSMTVTDSEGETASATITITVTDVAEADPEDKAAFVTTWQTDAANETIYIGLNNEYDYNFTINWGDGTVEEISLANPDYVEHVYAEADEYHVAIIGGFPAIQMGAIDEFTDVYANLDPAPKEGFGLVGIEQWGSIQWQTMDYAFDRAYVLEAYTATDVPDLSQVTSMQAMFNLAYVFNGDISGWNVGAVTNMRLMFSGTYAFNQDISGWNVSNVTDISLMFFLTEAFNQDLNDWDVGAVTNMEGVFNSATAFNQDISGWNVGKVTNMELMFLGATSFDQNLGGWNISSVSSMKGMFNNSGMDAQTSMTQTLQGWASFVDTNQVPIEVDFSQGLTGFEFCEPSDAKTAIDWLEGTADWNITGEQYNICL